MSEHEIQAAAIAFLRDNYPHIAARLYAIPNGGARNIITGVRLKAEGVRRGVPDLCYPVPVFPLCGLYIEVKTPTGRISKEQMAELEMLELDGYAVAVCRSADDIVKTILEYRSRDA